MILLGILATFANVIKNMLQISSNIYIVMHQALSWRERPREAKPTCTITLRVRSLI